MLSAEVRRKGEKSGATPRVIFGRKFPDRLETFARTVGRYLAQIRRRVSEADALPKQTESPEGRSESWQVGDPEEARE